MKIIAKVGWNNQHSAVEVKYIRYSAVEVKYPRSDREHQDSYLRFLDLPPQIKNTLWLEYTADGYVLSGKGLATSLESWQAKAVEEKKAILLPNNQFLFDVEMPQENSQIRRSDSLTSWDCSFNGQQFDGFETRLQAERFLARLWQRSKGLYFIDLDDDDRLKKLQAEYQNPNLGRSRQAYCDLQKYCISVGFEAVPWCIRAEANDVTEKGDSIWFDFQALPKWTGNYYAVQAAIDGTEDFGAAIVKADVVSFTLHTLIDAAVGWFADNETGNMQSIKMQAEKVQQAIAAAVKAEIVGAADSD
jgi:hypothetical protein